MGEESTQAIEVKRTLTLGPSLSGFLTPLHPRGLIFFVDRIMIIITTRLCHSVGRREGERQ